jgi:hypothetical protein
MRLTKLENGWWYRSFESYPEEQMEPTTANVRITMVLLGSAREIIPSPARETKDLGALGGTVHAFADGAVSNMSLGLDCA